MFCSNCGKEIGEDSKFCQYCGKANINNMEILIDKNKQQKTNEEKSTFVGALIILAIFVIICIVQIAKEASNSTSATQTQQEIKQENIAKIKKIENYINEFYKSGIFVKVNKVGSDGNNKFIEIQADEYLWNNLPYDAKEATQNMFMTYYAIGNVTVLFKGYRTGQKLYPVNKNFKI